MAKHLGKSEKLTAFSLFPNLPTETQQYIWHLLAHSEPSQRGPHTHRIGPDGLSHKYPLGSLDSLEEASTVQLHIINNPHTLPILLQICSASREAAAKVYTRWPRYNGGYIYIKKARDTLHFAGSNYKNFWFLFALVDLSHWRTQTREDRLALAAFRHQMEGVRHLAIDCLLWEGIVKWHNQEAVSFFKNAFARITSLTICFPSSDAPPTGQERISDRRFCAVGAEILESGDHALLRLHQASGPLKTSLEQVKRSFGEVRRSFGDERCPEMKFAVGVDEEEYKRLPEEERFNCML